MIKLDSIPPSVKYPPTLRVEYGPAHRLIVLFPASAGHVPSPTHRIWEIARSSGLNVLILSLCSDYYEESQLRRQLAMMAAMISDDRVHTEISIEHGNDWIGKVKNIYRPGDAVACYAGQRVGLMRNFLHEVLRSKLGAPIYVLSVNSPIKNPRPKLLSSVSLWLGTLGILGGFSWMEMKIIDLPQDWVHTSFLYVCVFIEIGLVWLWNSNFPPSP